MVGLSVTDTNIAPAGGAARRGPNQLQPDQRRRELWPRSVFYPGKDGCIRTLMVKVKAKIVANDARKGEGAPDCRDNTIKVAAVLLANRVATK